MNRDIQSASRLISVEEVRRNWVKHEDRLIHIRPMVNSREPTQYHPHAKKINYAQSLEVELQNKALLKKLTDRVDNRYDPSMNTTLSLPKSNRKKYYESHRIKWENQGLYKRLKQAKPAYDRSKLEQERKKNEKYLNTISKYGIKGFKPNKTFINYQNRNNDLKYLSKRKILLNSIDGEEQSHIRSSISPTVRLEKQNMKIKNNHKLFQHFARHKLIVVDSQQVLLKVTENTKTIKLELKSIGDKENQKNAELEVKIGREMFQGKFNSELEKLLQSLRFNQSSQQFYIV